MVAGRAGPAQLRQIPGRLQTSVYNIEVEDVGTYYVGELGVWVHGAHGEKDCG